MKRLFLIAWRFTRVAVRWSAQRSWLACALLPVVAVAECDRRPVQPERIQAIGRDMLVNGVPTAVYGLEFAQSADRVSDAFRAFWAREGVPAKARLESSGLLLTALDGACHYVLLITPVRKASPAKGVMSVMRLNGGTARHRIPDTVAPLPPGSKTVSDIESHDPGQTGRTWIVRLDGDAASQARRYGNVLAAQGWTTVALMPVQPIGGTRQTQAVGSAIGMQRGRDRVDAVFSDRLGQTQAVIHVTRNH
ncbi:hypothetical protein [Paraburkholderia rhizosphaerae]|uniref:Uncharacterized protein n=1 Tax=Paraburkholderia rhizosphaerae TaxID=480658 RepID=A0A4R8M005_9BURK|nr:hypothetical protein [Paraburkholderia rhizosphaerae]TDY54556.1 hypothetical protein BX592_10112 [Paraburkholderia rhizosphaerae]